MNIPRNPILYPTLYPTLYPKVFLTLLLTIIGATPAAAHSFNLVMLLPASGIDKPLQDDLMQAFLLASQERDSHADETSDGHLGGLDVFITFTTNPNQIEAADPDIIAIPLARPPLPGPKGRLALGPPDLTNETAIALLATASDPSLLPFASRFNTATGRAPGPEANALYVSARLIGQAVRQTGGIDDPARLRRLLGQ